MREAVDPFLDAGMRAWIAKTARKEFWRVAEYYALEDLVQDGYMCYYKCRTHYYDALWHAPNPTKDQRRHAMSLLQTTYYNHIYTLARRQAFVPERAISQLVEEGTPTDAAWDKLLPPEPATAVLSALMASAPQEIKDLAQLLLADVVGFARKRVGRRKVRETTNEYYCRLLGLSPDVDMVGRVKAYFGGVV